MKNDVKVEAIEAITNWRVHPSQIATGGRRRQRVLSVSETGSTVLHGGSKPTVPYIRVRDGMHPSDTYIRPTT